MAGLFESESETFDLIPEFIITSSVLDRDSFKMSISSSLCSRIANLVVEEISSEDSFSEKRSLMI